VRPLAESRWVRILVDNGLVIVKVVVALHDCVCTNNIGTAGCLLPKVAIALPENLIVIYYLEGIKNPYQIIQGIG